MATGMLYQNPGQEEKLMSILLITPKRLHNETENILYTICDPDSIALVSILSCIGSNHYHFYR